MRNPKLLVKFRSNGKGVANKNAKEGEEAKAI